MQHFINHIRNRKHDAWPLLIIDEFESHSIILFLELATVNNIVLFRFFVHFIHFTQSLDVKVFQSYKHHHVEAVDTVVRMKDSEFEKLKFLAAFQIFRIENFKPFTICHVFRNIGFVFFNPNMVLDKIREKNVKASIHRSRTFSLQRQLVERTSKESALIRKFGGKIERALKNIRPDGAIMTRKNVDRFQRYIRGIMIAVNTLNLAIRNLDMIQRTKIKRTA